MEDTYKGSEEFVRRRVVEREVKRPDVGRGIPHYFMPVVEKRRSEQKILKSKSTSSRFSTFTSSLNLEEYTIEDELAEPPKEGEIGLDVTVLDRYNDEIRKYRKILIEQCRLLPPVQTEDMDLELLEDAIQKLCRNAYFGTIKAQKLAEGAIPLLVWLLNRKGFAESFIVILLKSIAELCWNSVPLKSKFYKCYGAKVLYQRMTFAPERKRTGCWCAYTMAMIATGSAEFIIGARKIIGMEETISELSFEYYWYDWPVNFGMVLQAIMYGPDSVSPAEELFQFQ